MVIMYRNNHQNLDIRHCQQTPMAITDAQEEYIGVAMIIVVGWGMFIAILSRHLDLEKLGELFSAAPDAYWMLGGLGGVAWLFVTTLLFKHAQQILRTAEELEQEGMSASAMIIDKWQQGSTGCYCLAYCFSYMNNIWIGEQLAISAPYKKLQIGDCVTARFSPGNPRISRITETHSLSAAAIHPWKTA